MNHLQAPKKQTQTKPISPTPKGVKQKSDAGFQRSDICLLSSAFCFLSSVHGPKIAIAFDYNGIFVTRLGSPGIICLI
jgi:hypothetical protein